jgi:hypothetical protein
MLLNCRINAGYQANKGGNIEGNEKTEEKGKTNNKYLKNGSVGKQGGGQY